MAKGQLYTVPAAKQLHNIQRYLREIIQNSLS